MNSDIENRRNALLQAQAAADQELDAANALRLDAEASSNIELQSAWRSARHLRSIIKRHAINEHASPELRSRILALAPIEQPRNSIRYNPALFGGLAASLLAVSFIAGYFTSSQRMTVNQPEPALVDSFVRSQLAGQPFDVASSDRHTVKPWLAARTPLGAEVVDLTEAGFPLAGGRLDIVDQAPVATLIYRRREHWIDVTELPLRNGTPNAGVSKDDSRGYHIWRWSDDSRVYVAISDIDEGELTTFVDAFRGKAKSTNFETGKP